MRILQICPRVPFPPNDGGTIAMAALSSGLALNKHDVHVFALNTKKHFADENHTLKFLPPGVNISSVYVDSSVGFFPAFINLFSDKSYNISRFFSKNAEQKLISILSENKFDLVLFESLYTAPYLQSVNENSGAKAVLRAHNIEHLIWERMAEAQKSKIKKKYFNLLAGRLRNFEKRILNEFDAIVPITNFDAEQFVNSGCRVPIHVSPVGVDPTKYFGEPFSGGEISLFHFGSMDWMPNDEAVKWFLQNVWGKVHSLFPELKVYLAGRKIPTWLKKINLPNVIVEENIPEPKKYMATKTIMVVPLLSGSGMRVKIIEGMASGKTVISTSIGAEGIDITPGKNILIADTPEEFAKQIFFCLNNPEGITSIGVEARNLIKTKYSNQKICSELGEFFEKIISGYRLSKTPNQA